MTLSFAQLGRKEVRNRDVADAVLRLLVVLNRHTAIGHPVDGGVDEDRRRAGVELDALPSEREEFPDSKSCKNKESSISWSSWVRFRPSAGSVFQAISFARSSWNWSAVRAWGLAVRVRGIAIPSTGLAVTASCRRAILNIHESTAPQVRAVAGPALSATSLMK
jgi:hypothetical protein